MRTYESVCIFAPNLTEAEVDKHTEKFTTVVTSRGGSVTKVDRQGLKRFAVPVKRHAEGWNVVWEFEAAPEVVAEVTRVFGVTDVLLRGMVVHKSKTPPAPEKAPNSASPSTDSGREESEPAAKLEA